MHTENINTEIQELAKQAGLEYDHNLQKFSNLLVDEVLKRKNQRWNNDDVRNFFNTQDKRVVYK